MWRRLFLVVIFLCYAAAPSIADALTLQVPIGNSATDIPGYLSAVYQWLIRAAVVFAMVAFVVGGIIWTTAGGNKQRVEKAKDIIKNTLIGMGLALGSYAMLFAINPALVNWKNIEPDKVSEAGLTLEWKKEDDAKPPEDVCNDEIAKLGGSWGLIVSKRESCTAGTEKDLGGGIVEKCVGSGTTTYKCFVQRPSPGGLTPVAGGSVPVTAAVGQYATEAEAQNQCKDNCKSAPDGKTELKIIPHAGGTGFDCTCVAPAAPSGAQCTDPHNLVLYPTGSDTTKEQCRKLCTASIAYLGSNDPTGPKKDTANKDYFCCPCF